MGSHTAQRDAARLNPPVPCFDPCCGELYDDRIAAAEVQFVRREKDSPEERPIEPQEMGDVVAIARVDGPHHRYSHELRRAA